MIALTHSFELSVLGWNTVDHYLSIFNLPEMVAPNSAVNWYLQSPLIVSGSRWGFPMLFTKGSLRERASIEGPERIRGRICVKSYTTTQIA